MVGRPDPRPAGGPVASLPATPRDADGPRGPSRAVSRVGASALRPWALVLCDARRLRDGAGGVLGPVGGELLLSPQSVEIIKFSDPGSGR